MRIIDEKFAQNKLRYVSQCLLAVFVLGLILQFLDIENNSAVVAALGASSFIVFTMSEAKVAHPRFLIGGYIIGIIVGTAFNFLLQRLVTLNTGLPYDFLLPTIASVAVGVAIFAMVVLDFEHPPGAGVALGMVINEWNINSVIAVMIGISLLAILKTMLRPVLKSLL